MLLGQNSLRRHATRILTPQPTKLRFAAAEMLSICPESCRIGWLSWPTILYPTRPSDSAKTAFIGEGSSYGQKLVTA
jgi:hypothetical protein